MATIKKPTLKEMYTDLLTIPAVAENPDRVAFINGRIQALDKKSASSKGKTTKTQKENAGTKELILAVLRTMKNGATCTKLLKADEGLAEFSNQKLSALLRQMITEGLVTRTEVKGKAIFSAVPTDENEEGEE